MNNLSMCRSRRRHRCRRRRSLKLNASIIALCAIIPSIAAFVPATFLRPKVSSPSTVYRWMTAASPLSPQPAPAPVVEDSASSSETIPSSSSDLPPAAVPTDTPPQQQPIVTTVSDSFGMAEVQSVVAVSSCKGGVGKSTTAVNLAYALSAMGASVGILDCDVYGPSMPTMIKPDDDMVRFVGRQISPLTRSGVKLMSFGYINEGSAVMRGPMVSQLLDQFMDVTNWGAIDYLILDMPPGTGDIQLTLTQKLNITAAVIVTTPQELSYADVVRGIEMFDSVNVPCVSVIENMAYYEVEKTPKIDTLTLQAAFAKKIAQQDGEDLSAEALAAELVDIAQRQQQESAGETEKVNIFGPGHKRLLSEQYGIDHTFSMPLLDTLAKNGDSGTPYMLEYPDSPQADIYHDLAASVVIEVAKAQFSGSNNPDVSFDKETHMMKVDDDTISPADLRRGCRCAACVEELTGRQILVPNQVPEAIRPLRMGATGNYALSIDWSDGHKSLYPYRQIQSMIDEPAEGATEPAPPREAAKVPDRFIKEGNVLL